MLMTNASTAALMATALLAMATMPARAQDSPHIQLQSNFIGDKEQPSVSYFIPWKEIGTPDKLLWDLDSKYDKTLSLVDRQVLLRATSLYNEMNMEADLTIARDN